MIKHMIAYFQKQKLVPVKKFLIYFSVSLLSILLYVEVSHFWVNIGGFSGLNNYIEIPLLFIILGILYIPNQHTYKSILYSLTLLIPIYLLYDLFYFMLKRSPRISDIQDLSTLFDVSLLLIIPTLTIFILSLIQYLYFQIRYIQKFKKFNVAVYKTITLLILITVINTNIFTDYYLKVYQYLSWTQEKNIKNNGRFASILYYSQESKRTDKLLKVYKNRNFDVNKLLFNNAKITEKKNIYMVVLESFIDPRELQDVNFSISPLHPNMNKYLINGKFSYTNSPVYGGGTAQAEFEILTGSKAFGKVNTIDFNTLNGHTAPGFVNLLSKHGYDNVATVATSSGYFNSMQAYKSIGFKNIIFLEESNKFNENENDKRIFDGDLYNYSFQQTKKLQEPYLVYLLGMYGHFPYSRNKDERPDKIKSNSNDKRITRIANQFYYRTKALASYIDNILKNDPMSVILVTSDHLPPLINKGIQYKNDLHLNISLLLIDGNNINISRKNYYEFSQIILSRISNFQAKKIDEETMQEIYFKLLSESNL